MAEKSIGTTGGIHKKLQQIKKENDVTMSGFVSYALDEILSRKGSINSIVEKIYNDNAEKLGSRRLDYIDFGS